jgi:lysophospholipase L1-like esterase
MGVIVFTGDSITDCDRRADPAGLGYGYVDMVARDLAERGDPSTVVNTGIAGNRVADLVDRWQVDAVDHSPELLSVYVGVNDTLASFFRGRPTPLPVFEEQYTDILDRSVAAGVRRLILIEPFFVDSDLPSVRWGEGYSFIHEDLAPRRAVVRSLAERYHAALVPLQSLVDTVVASRGATMVAADGVHPTPLGHRLIADSWLSAFDSFTASASPQAPGPAAPEGR